MSMESTQPSAGDEIVNGHATLPDRTKGVFGGGVAIGYDFYDPFQLPVRLELDTTFRGETDAKGGQDIIAFGQPVHINVKIRSNDHLHG